MSVSTTTGIPECCDLIIGHIAELILLTLLGIIFRLRSSDAANYSMVGEKYRTVPVEIDFALGGEGKTWEEGMQLPVPPVIVPTPAVLVLATPSGTKSVHAEMSVDPVENPEACNQVY